MDNQWEPTVPHKDLRSGLCGDLKERKSKKEGARVYGWLVHFALGQKITQRGKATTRQPNLI